jgi:hypothetical protein
MGWCLFHNDGGCSGKFDEALLEIAVIDEGIAGVSVSFCCLEPVLEG